MSEQISKAENSYARTRPLTSERGQPHIVSSSRFINNQKNSDLRMPKRLCTFDTIACDDAVSTSLTATGIDVLLALYNGEFKPARNTSLSRDASDFLNHNIRNMSTGTWLEAMNNANTSDKYGFAFQNIVLEKAKYGQYKDFLTLKKLAPRDQKSIYGWVWDKNLRDFMGFIQKPMLKKLRDPKLRGFNQSLAINDVMNFGAEYPFLRIDQLLHFAFDPVNNNPEGQSPLLAVYDIWMEKKLIEKYEIIGVSKDMGGAVVLRIPGELIRKAADPVNYPAEAAEYQALQDDANALQAGESSSIILASDVDNTSKVAEYGFELLGIDGGGKQYSTEAIVARKNRGIYNLFGTGNIILGQEAAGADSLSSDKTSLFGHYVARSILWKVNAINHQLAPRLLAENGLHLDWKDMPQFHAADASDASPEEWSKFIQRVASVGMMTPRVLNAVYDKMDFSTEGIEDLVFDEGNTSRGGESQGTSGTGSTQSGGANSSTNNENKSVKTFVKDHETDDTIWAISNDGETIKINKD